MSLYSWNDCIHPELAGWWGGGSGLGALSAPGSQSCPASLSTRFLEVVTLASPHQCTLFKWKVPYEHRVENDTQGL